MSKDPIALAIDLMQASLETKRAEVSQIESALAALQGKAPKPKKQLALPSPEHFKKERKEKKPRRKRSQPEADNFDYSCEVNGHNISMNERHYELMCRLIEAPEDEFVTREVALRIFDGDKKAFGNAVTVLRPRLKKAGATIGVYRGHGLRLENIEAEQ